MTKSIKINTEIQEMLQLVSIEEVTEEFGEAVASTLIEVAKDQVVTWAKFVLTDDQPNVNKQRVPSEEFDNIISTGYYKPVKMALGEIKDGHESAEPIGVITHLSKEDNKIIALAALWNTERQEDVQMIKDRVSSDKPVNVSWEILYGKRRVNNGITDLLDTVLRAVTIVGLPAYAGRTPFLAVAAKRWSPAYVESLPDDNFLHLSEAGARLFPFKDEEGNIDGSRFEDILQEISASELPENLKKSLRHQAKKLSSMSSMEVETPMEDELDIKELEGTVAVLNVKLAEASDKESALATEIETLKNAKAEADNTIKTLEEEIAPLREFKQQADEEVLKLEKLESIKAKFSEKGLEKPSEYFDENAEKLLALDENGLEFMLQELVTFGSNEQNTTEASRNKSSIPNLAGKGGNVSLADIAKALRERNK